MHNKSNYYSLPKKKKTTPQLSRSGWQESACWGVCFPEENEIEININAPDTIYLIKIISVQLEFWNRIIESSKRDFVIFTPKV